MQHAHGPRPRPGRENGHPSLQPLPERLLQAFLGQEGRGHQRGVGDVAAVWGSCAAPVLTWALVFRRREPATEPRHLPQLGEFWRTEASTVHQMLDVCGGGGLGYFRTSYFPWQKENISVAT